MFRSPYILNYIHSILYLCITTYSYNILWNIGYHPSESSSNKILLTETYEPPINPILVSIIFGWSLYSISGIGHDAVHGSFSPSKKVNRIVSFLMMDMGPTGSAKNWKHYHNKIHHQSLHSPEDRMRLYSTYVIKEWWILIRDTWMLGEPGIFKIPLAYLILQIPYYLIPFVYLSFFFSVGYLAYLPHSLPTIYRDQPKMNTRLHHFDYSWDIFPDSHLLNFLTGSLNIHASHHCYPQATRSSLMTYAKSLEARYPDRYRSIKTWKEFKYFWSHRHETTNKRPHFID